MDTTIQLLVQMNESVWNRFKDDLKDATPEEIDWRPLPQANSINAIVRHLLIEARWHLMSLEKGEPMPAQVTHGPQHENNSAPLDFERNFKELEEWYTRFVAALRQTTPLSLQERTVLAYQNFPQEASRPAHLLGFHQAIHLATHLGQVRTIRNLYRKTRGELPRFFPDNPTFPV